MIGRIVSYIKDSRKELQKVVWPSAKQTRNHTIMVIAVSLAVAAFLGAVDYLLNLALEAVI